MNKEYKKAVSSSDQEHANSLHEIKAIFLRLYSTYFTITENELQNYQYVSEMLMRVMTVMESPAINQHERQTLGVFLGDLAMRWQNMRPAQ